MNTTEAPLFTPLLMHDAPRGIEGFARAGS